MKRFIRPCARALLAFTLLLALAGCGKPHFTTEEHIQRAKDFSANSRYSEAFIELRNVLQQQPDHPQGNLLLAEIILKMGDPFLAETSLKKAREIGVSVKSTRMLMSRALMAQGRFNDVLQEVALDPDASLENRLDQMNIRGEALMALSRANESCDQFDAMLRLRPGHPPALLGKSRCAAARQDFALSRKIIDEAIQLDPTHTESWIQLGHMERGQNRYAEAETAYGKALATRPSDVDALMGRAMARLKLRKFDAARQDMKIARAIIPSSPLPTHMLGIEAYYHGDYHEAKIQFQRVLNVLPDYLPSLFWQGLTDLNLDNVEQALKGLSYYMERKPDDQTAKVLLAYAQARQGNKISAEKTLKALRNLGLEDAAVLSMSGQTYLALGKLEEAQRYLREALAKDPINVELKLSLAESHRQKREYDDFLRELNEAVALEPASIQLHSQYTQALIAQDKKEAARAKIAEMRRLFPKSTQPQYLEASMALKAGDRNSARQAFGEMLNIDPTSATAYMNLARMDLGEGKVEQAKQRFLGLYRRDNNNYTALIGMAAIHYAVNDLKAQREWLGKAIRVRPKALEPILLLAKNLLSTGQGQQALSLATQAYQAEPANPATLRLLADVQSANGAHDNARSSYTRLTTLTPDAPEAWFQLGLAHERTGFRKAAIAALRKATELSPLYLYARLELARTEAKDGNLAEAHRLVTMIKNDFPRSAPAYLLAGDLYLGQKKPAEALREYEQGASIKPSTQLTMRSANALLALGRGNAAETLLRQWLRQYPTDRVARLNLAGLCASTGKFEAALAEYEQINRAKPNQPEILNDMAWLHQKHGNVTRALSLSEQALKLAPDNPNLMDTLGWILLQQGEQRRALVLLRKAAELAPKHPSIQYHFAAVLARTGDVEKARQVLQLLLTTAPSFRERADAETLLKGL